MARPEHPIVESAGRSGAGVRRHSAVATAHPLATDAALDILHAGGNAVDAAVAAAWALSVCEPSASGLGGQTTVLLHRPGDAPLIIDGHSYAPSTVSVETVSRSEQRVGHRACVIPSTVATLGHVQRRYGRLPRRAVMAAAVRIAEGGYDVTSLLRRQIRWTQPALSASKAMGASFLPGGCVPEVGSRLRHPALAATLRRLQEAGEDDFYRGDIAEQIIADMTRHGGLIAAEDLATFTLPVERAALVGSYCGFRVVTAPPPAGGLQLLLGLKLVEYLERHHPSVSPDEWRANLALATYAVFRGRDHDGVSVDVPSEGSDRFLQERTVTLARVIADRLPDPIRTVEEPGDTTHLTVADADGTVVALTQSIQSVFGAKVAHGGLGFIYNNYLRTCPRRPHPHQLAAGCLPRSNVAPALVFEAGQDDRPMLALGAAGSRRITSALLHVITGVLDRGLNVQDAMAAPRVHALTNGKAWVERPAATEALLALLRQRAFRVIVKRPLDFSMGSVQAVRLFPDGRMDAAADPRRDGVAKGV